MFLIEHTEVSEFHSFAKEILGKVPIFELLQSVKTYIKNCTKLSDSSGIRTHNHVVSKQTIWLNG